MRFKKTDAPGGSGVDPETRCSKKSLDMSNVTNLRSRNPLAMVLEPSEVNFNEDFLITFELWQIFTVMNLSTLIEAQRQFH